MFMGATVSWTVLISFLELGRATTVTSTDGLHEYNCPDVEPIEVAYATSCPAFSRNKLFEYSGTSLQADYSSAPSSYIVPPDGLSLICEYEAIGAATAYFTCLFQGGSTQVPVLATGQNRECPDFGQTFPEPQPSKRASVNKRSFSKRTGQSPAYSCPWGSTMDGGNYVSEAQINTGSRVPNTNTSPYVCQVSVAASPDPVICTYGNDGVPASDTESTECPSQLCNVAGSSKRSFGRRGSSMDDPIARRQVDTSALRLGRARK